MLVLNFSHPITPEQSATIRDMLGAESLEILDIPVQIDMSQPLDIQVAAIVDACSLSPVAWQTTPFLVRSAALPEAANAILAEIHGRTVGFPLLVTFRRNAAGIDEVWDLVDLQMIRETARMRRT